MDTGRLVRESGGPWTTYHPGAATGAGVPPRKPREVEETTAHVPLSAAGAAMDDPFEQAFFVMVQLPYLRPFDDVNERVSRLAANIPFIRTNLAPLSFIDVPRALYPDAGLGVYELNRIDLFRDLFVWAYERSAARYAAVRQSRGEPDPFRLRHREALRRVGSDVVRGGMDRKTATAHIGSWSKENLPPAARERFREVAESELLDLHAGNFARYRVRPAEFAAWQAIWSGTPAQPLPATRQSEESDPG